MLHCLIAGLCHVRVSPHPTLLIKRCAACLPDIGTHLVNNMLGLAGHVRSVTAVGTTGGRQITPHDVLPSPMGMGIIAGIISSHNSTLELT